MQRNFLRGFLICLVPCLLAAFYAFRFDKYKLGIDLAGGTILVYEINLERTKLRKETLGEQQAGATGASEGLTKEEVNQLAAQIKRRIDPTDIKNVTVRPIGTTRIEIILPVGGGSARGRENLTAEEIEEIKRLISQMGVLEFRILANGHDDAEGIAAARDSLERKDAAELEARARKGLPPEGPEGEFEVVIGETRASVRYQWAELAPEERETLGLSNRFEGSGGLWAEAARARQERKVLFVGRDRNPVFDISQAAMVLYSRECLDEDQLAREEAEKQRLIREGKSEAEAEKLVDRKKYEYFLLTRVSPEDALRVGGDITLTANVGVDRAYNPAVDFIFNSAGARQFGRITRRNKPSSGIERHLAILLDGRIVSAPTLQQEITSHGQIHGRFDRKTVERLVHILRSGALSAELREKPVSENTIGPTLGADTIRRGTFSIAAAFVTILLFMLIYYRFAGLVACIALLANLLLTVGFMVAVNAAFTLPGLAGLVLTLGMAVDANILIYERIREERNKGASLALALRNGYSRVLPTILDTHLTSIFTAIVLYVFGNDQLKGFAIALTLGLVISLFTALYMTRLIFDYGMVRRWITQLRMLRLFDRPNFNPMKYRLYFFTVTTILTLLGLGLFLYRGEDGLNVDFRGGTVFAGRLKEGEERALTRTPDGKAGFRDLLGEENQQRWLNAIDARWINQTEGGTAAANVFIYQITYQNPDGSTSQALVTLSQKPGRAGEIDIEEMKQNVLARARTLPDVSVEQMYLSGESYPDGKSRYFTIRTTEREDDLVRVSLQRLLRDDNGRSILDGATLDYTVEGGVVHLTFSRPTSRSYVEKLLEREFYVVLQHDPRGVFTLTGAGDAVEGRYTQMRLDVSRSPEFSQLAAAKPDPEQQKLQRETLDRVLRSAQQTFNNAPEPERLEVFDSQLAADTRQQALFAILASWVAMLLYLWFRFGNWTFGLAAVLCLIHDLCFTLGAIAVCHYLHVIPGMNMLGIQDFKIDLAAVAALLTLVGYSVNDTIVVFDRIREVRGKDPRLTPQMINDSVNQTLGRTVLASLTVFLVAFVLYAFGGEGVHLFSFIMLIGVIVGTYSSIFVASPLLLFFGEGQQERVEVTALEAAATVASEEVVEG